MRAGLWSTVPPGLRPTIARRAGGYGLRSTALLILLLLPAACHAETISSNELITTANAIDGSTVTYKGEIVTAIMKRGENSWINLNDGYNAIGVWCQTKHINDVKTLGDYKHEGDILQVTGIFHRACPMHGGELDIHADKVNIEARGFLVQERVSRKRINTAIVLFIMTILAIIILRKRI